MNRDFSQKIQTIREQVNIVDIIGQYLKLTRKGNNFWAVCPFHQDSNPSLSVSQEKQIYKCFSCGEQGNVFIFLQKYKKIDFLPAVKEVATIAKIDLEKLQLNLSEPQKIKLHPFKILNNLALNFYQYQMTTDAGQKAFNYLKERKVSESNINDFALGFAPKNNELLEYLKLQGYQTDEIIAAGLAKVSTDDHVKDMFFNRIIFPIIDLDGECLGFSARSFNATNTSFKYVNTSENQIFKKGQILYNLYNAKNSLSVKNSNIYLVEGYMDVISLSSQGISNVVALMGTNLTKEHITTLKKITNDIVIFLDGDNAGKEAAVKIATNLLAHNFNTKIIDNQTNQDPDELIKNNLEQFKTVINSTLHPLDFAINFYQTKYKFKEDSDQLKQFLNQLQGLWAAIQDPIVQQFYFDKLAKMTNLNSEVLSTILKVTPKPLEPVFDSYDEPYDYQENQPKQKQLPIISLNQKFLERQKELFFLLLLDAQVYQILEKEKFIFDDNRLMNLHYFVSEKYRKEKSKQIDVPELLVLLKDNDIYDFLVKLIEQYQNKKYHITKTIIKDCIRNIEKSRIDLKTSDLKQKIANAKDEETKIELVQQMFTLKNKLNKE